MGGSPRIGDSRGSSGIGRCWISTTPVPQRDGIRHPPLLQKAMDVHFETGKSSRMQERLLAMHCHIDSSSNHHHAKLERENFSPKFWIKFLSQNLAWICTDDSCVPKPTKLNTMITNTSIATYKPMYYLYMMYTLYTLACSLFCSSIFLHTQIYNVRVLLATTSLVSLVHMSVILHRHDCAGWNGSKKSWFQRMKRRYRLTVN